MDVNVKNNVIEVSDIIKTNDDVDMILSAIEGINDNSIILDILDSVALPSRVLGKLMWYRDNGIDITIKARNPKLYELLEDLNMTSEFNVVRG
ncbi:MAG: hypothetical protein GXO62_08260 [Epsilonproteobacteria bacterium]|nr:hypothetical protein [Campylobacterota bacterium]